MSNEELWQLFPIILSAHDRDWPKRYETEKDCLVKAVGAENIVRISALCQQVIHLKSRGKIEYIRHIFI